MTTCIFIAIPKDYDISYSSTEKLLCAVDGNWYRDQKKKKKKAVQSSENKSIDCFGYSKWNISIIPLPPKTWKPLWKIW